jgi:exopolyphosphatase / guanosine-5'-triphosphate,3'-diphosphate pyrophosphatase
VPRFAAIDVGSNALRLRIVDICTVGTERGAPVEFTEVLSQRAAVRLGTDVFLTQLLSPTSIVLACQALRDFRRIMDTANIDGYRATATSAVREANNGATLIERAHREAGIELEIIEGTEEARLVRLAVARRVPLDATTALLIDVGGGSSEFTVLDRGEHIVSISLPLGSVRLLETYLKDRETVDKKQLKLIDESVDRGLKELDTRLEGRRVEVLVGTGGNVDTLANLCPVDPLGSEREHGPASEVRDRARAIDIARMGQLVEQLCSMSTAERKATYKLRTDRADTIIPASRVFLRAAAKYGIARMVAPGVGLKEGILIELVDRHFRTWHDTHESEGVLDSCLRLGRRFRFDEAHGLLVSRFSAQIFDATKAIHGLSERARLLLRTAAVLHDIGDFLRYEGHHKHSAYMIQNAEILALSPGERTIVANVARYHRKSVPDVEHPNFRALDKDARVLVRNLTAMLRVADALDRDHRGNITAIAPHVSGGHLYLAASGTEERVLEEWTARSKSDLLREVLGLELEFGALPPAPNQAHTGQKSSVRKR